MALTKEAKALRNSYLRDWRRRNPEKAKAIQERYLNKKAEQLKADENGRRQRT